jgi:hypothetical protein
LRDIIAAAFEHRDEAGFAHHVSGADNDERGPALLEV